ncbi:MAG TPA: HD domain-containing phosphohydrolase [Chthonomonadaceae bacterium]|nr:HD domain-containing phosphohydrolase [Chthonomonadaceae bacterium]
MIPSPYPPNEAERLQSLRRYGILDTLPEEAFDVIAQTASRLCRTPMALISFVDADRQWFKAQIGADLTETPREISFCAHAILQDTVFCVADALDDPRFAGNPLVTAAPYVRFYAGAPLITSEGHALGALCVLDQVPHQLTQDQETMLQSLAKQVVTQLELRSKITDLERAVVEREWAEEALEIKQALLTAVVEGSPDIMYVKNLQGQYQLLNSAGVAALQRTEAEVIGNDDRVLFPGEVAQRILALDQQIMQTGEALTYEADVTIAEQRLTYLTTKQAYLNPRGEIIGLVGISRDITQRKQMERLLERQVQQLTALHSIDLAINASLDLRLTLKILLDQLRAQLGVDHAEILLMNPYTQTLEYATEQSIPQHIRSRDRQRVGVGPAGKAALERRMISASDLLGVENNGQPPSERPEELPSYFAVPLMAKGQVKGVLELYCQEQEERDASWFTFLETLAGQAAIAIDHASLFEDLQRANSEMLLAYDATIEGWSRALDLRDKETEGHSQRVTELTLHLARVLGISEAEIVHVRRGALLHDIGKLGVPDSILLKPGSLTETEWEVMRRHPIYAYEMLAPIAFLRSALDIPYCHHEKWDGAGYPRGLKGTMIPLPARIFALADIWDALRSDRPYRKGWPTDRVLAHIISLSGTHLDPQVVEVFLQHQEVLASPLEVKVA